MYVVYYYNFYHYYVYPVIAEDGSDVRYTTH